MNEFCIIMISGIIIVFLYLTHCVAVYMNDRRCPSVKKKYKLTNETVTVNGKILYRIKALRSFVDIKKGSIGGWIESEGNLSHGGYCWVGDNAMVYENAYVQDNARVYGNARVFDCAKVYGNSKIFGNAIIHGHTCIYDDVQIYDHAELLGNSVVCDNAQIYGEAQILIDTWILEDSKINSGIWDKTIIISGNRYLISTTLEKVFVGKCRTVIPITGGYMIPAGVTGVSGSNGYNTI